MAMESTDAQDATVSTHSPNASVGRMALSVLECPFRPAAAARRTLNCSLPSAYLVHLFSALAIVTAVMVARAATEFGPDMRAFDLLARTLEVWANLLLEFVDYALPMTLSVIGIEIGYASLAVWILPWGAGDEPLKLSIHHALRRIWMQTPQLFLFVVIMGSTIAFLDRTRAEWVSAHSAEYEAPRMPPMPPGIQPGTPQWDQYQTELDAYSNEWSRIQAGQRAAQPWYIRHGAPAAGVGCFLFGLLFLTSLLRASGVPRTLAPIPRRPQCEACGYDLTSIPLDSRCPECGEPVVAALGPDARPGPPWKNGALGAVASWHQTWRTAVFSPTRFGRSLRTIDPGVEHRRFLVLHLPLVFLIGAVAPTALYYALEGHSPLPNNFEIVFFVGPVVGLLCAVGVTSVTLVIASGLGFDFHRREKRNLLAAAVQATCYLTPLLVAWEFFGGATGILALTLGQHDPFRTWAREKHLDPEFLCFCLWAAPNSAWAITYYILARRATAAARYANR